MGMPSWTPDFHAFRLAKWEPAVLKNYVIFLSTSREHFRWQHDQDESW